MPLPNDIHSILTTLKITKKPSDAPVAKKTPVRRAETAKRDRTQAPPKPVPKADDTHAESIEKDKMDSRFRGNDMSSKEGARQRNHRFDGKAHGEPFSQNIAGEKPETERPLRSNLRAESTSESKQSGLINQRQGSTSLLELTRA